MTRRDVTVVVPRKDVTDTRWNIIQEYAGSFLDSETPYVVGTYDQGQDAFWSMSRAVNAGRKSVTTVKMLITPADYIIQQDVVEQVSEMLDDHCWWGPFQNVHRLTEQHTAAVLTGFPYYECSPVYITPVCRPCIAVRTDVFDDVGGMDGRFTGWAPEDAAFRRKLIVLYGEPAAPQIKPVFELMSDRDARPNEDENVALYHNEYLNVKDAIGMRELINRQLNAGM
jgi:hypothetical protein